MTKAIQWADLELINVLGEGHAGKVWLAKLKRQYKDFPTGSPVAVKCYKSWVLEEPGQYERIIRELELGRRIQHPNLVKTLSIIRDPDGNPALVMAYYAGETLDNYLERFRHKKDLFDFNEFKDVIASGETLETYLDEIWRKEDHVDLDFAFKIVGELASAISAIHQAGAIHRDIKPANIILNDNHPVLMDFGVISSKDFPEQTTSGDFLGTIRYAAPEYLFGESYSPNVDVYALGIIAFELFGEKQFLSEEAQWARLIVEKRNTQNVSLNYPALQRRYGMNTTEFIKFILERTVAKPEERTINMSYLSEVIKNRIWEKSFHINNGTLIEGEPKTTYLGEYNKESRTVLSQVVEDLRIKLSEEDRIFLCQLFTKEYHKFSHHKYPSFIFDKDRAQRLKEIGCFVNLGNVNEGDFGTVWYEFHEAVIAAYRYGYLC